METNRLCYNEFKTYSEYGSIRRIKVEVSLDDDCHNNVCGFGITAVIEERRKNGGWDVVGGGCFHDEIVKHFPELEPFIPLHCSNYLGQPMYPVENGRYHITKSTKEVAMMYLRCTEEQYSTLKWASEDKLLLKYFQFKLGLTDKWKKEADEFISFLEEKTGDKWVNPYKPEEERFVIRLTDDEIKDVEEKLNNGYWSKEEIDRRRDQRIREENDKKRQKVENEFFKAVAKAQRERDVMLYLIDNGMPTDNVIYYDHSNRLVFNWMRSRDLLSQERFDEFVGKADYSKLPNGIKIEMECKPNS